MREIREERDAGAFQALREEWQALVERSARATLYQTWEWNEAWWRAFGRGKQLRLLQIRDAGTLVGLVPLYVSRHLGTPLRRLALLGTGASDYLDAIAADGCEAAVAGQALAHLEKARGFHLADLQQLRPGSVLLSTPQEGACRRQVIAQEPCPGIALPDSWEAFTARLGRKLRSNLGYHERLLERSFPGAQIALAGEAELEAGLDALFQLHQRRWRARGLPGVLGGSSIQAFHRSIARRALERGWLRLHLLRIEGAVKAALYCFRFRGSTGYYLGGFAPELGRFSLGTLLTARAIRTAIEEGCGEFDFLRGAEPYKLRWQPEVRVNSRLLLAPGQGLGTRCLLGLNRLERWVEHRAKEFAESRGRRRKP